MKKPNLDFNLAMRGAQAFSERLWTREALRDVVRVDVFRRLGDRIVAREGAADRHYVEATLAFRKFHEDRRARLAACFENQSAAAGHG